MNTNFFFSNSSGTSGISRQNPGISRQKSLISLVSRHVSNFLAPPPFMWKTPAPPENIRTQKFGLFSCLKERWFSVATPADPRGEKLFFFVLILGCDPAWPGTSVKPAKGECERCFRASGVRVPKQSLARCKTVFWGVSPGAKQGLHGARDSFGTLGQERPNHF